MIRIYQLDKGFTAWAWLCGKCLKSRKRKGWEVKTDKDPPHSNLTCDDCVTTNKGN